MLGERVRAQTATLGSDEWNAADLAHLIPSANHEQFLIKASFTRTLDTPPRLRIENTQIDGSQTDTAGRFWQFRVTGLQSATDYAMELEQTDDGARTDPWSIRTFPAPGENVERFRIFTYTCAGGNERLEMADGEPFFLNMQDRRRLLRRGLSFNPDVVIANGDHIYWDQRTSYNKPGVFGGPWIEMFEEYGSLDSNEPMLGSANEDILTRVVDDQVVTLYGVTLRSVPSYFLSDDHDLLENDEANDTLVTLPPDRHMVDAARTTQRLYYPEFLPDPTRDRWLPGSYVGRNDDLSEVYGTLRYGTLFECLLYDTKRYVSLKGSSATIVPPEVEAWLARRAAASDTRHQVHMPGTPIGWSAGKWCEWYPDAMQANGSLGTATPKPYWQAGWWAQHQRIMEMLSAQRSRAPVIMSGDLHASSCGRIIVSGDLNVANNPVHTLCVGTLGSSGPGFPTRFRGVATGVPTNVTMEEMIAPLEKNGFSIIDVTPGRMRVRFYAWTPPEPSRDIDTMGPLYDYEIT